MKEKLRAPWGAQTLKITAILFIFVGQSSQVLATPITVLHTNDLHSHFRPEKSELGLGGIARIKTAVDRIKKQSPHTLFVDGGDWSEGQIYYNDRGGLESVKMMNRMGYDAVIAGNHDWINGPGVLLDNLNAMQLQTEFLAANLDVSAYPRGEEFVSKVKPYVIREKGGVKVGIIGLTTYEYVFDRFLAPVQIQEPIAVTRRLVKELKPLVDVIVVISHHRIPTNTEILKRIPEVDLLIGAHDHIKLDKPVVVKRRDGSQGWLVETGCWGKYLGRVDFDYEAGEVKFKKYQLIQMDSSVPEDPEILGDIERLEGQIEAKLGPVFHDQVAESEIEFHRKGISSPMGNLVTDAYREATHADIALDVINFIYGELHRGVITSADVFNSNPAVYNPETGKSWTLKTLPISGRILKLFLNVMFSSKKLGNFSFLHVSGMRFKFDPLFHSRHASSFESPFTIEEQAPGSLFSPFGQGFRLMSIPVVQDIEIQGEQIDSSKMYRVAMGQGMIYSIEFFNSHVLNLISMEELEDTKVEGWKILSDYLRANTPLSRKKFSWVDRIRTLQPDLGMTHEDVEFQPLKKVSGGMSGLLRVRVSNFGAAATEVTDEITPTVQLFANNRGMDYSVEDDFRALAEAKNVPVLQPGETKDFVWSVTLPEVNGRYGVTVKIKGVPNEVNLTNDEVTRWFK